MTRHYPDLDCACDWLNQISHAALPIRNTTQIKVMTRHHYEISALVSQMSLGGETSGSVAKCRLFTQVSFDFTQFIQLNSTQDEKQDLNRFVKYNSNTISVRTIQLATFQNRLASCSTDCSTVHSFHLFGYFNGSKIFPWNNF